MPSDPRLASLPAIIALAEEQAREQYEAEATLARAAGLGDSPDEPGDWTWLRAKHPRMARIRVQAHLNLITGLSRPTFRDMVARLVAPHLAGGVDAGWLISAIEAGSSDLMRGETWRHARKYAGVSADADTPAERCALIALATLGGPNG